MDNNYSFIIFTKNTNEACDDIWMNTYYQFNIGENTILVPIFWCYGQFGPCYFQLVVNLVPTVNSLTENAYMANGLPC